MVLLNFNISLIEFQWFEQENVLAESRMMVPDCHKRLEAALADLKGTLVSMLSHRPLLLALLNLTNNILLQAGLKESNQQGIEIEEADVIITEVEALLQTEED